MPEQARFSRTLTILCGLQGTGKSEAANIIAKKQGALLLRTDEISKEVIGEPSYTEQGVFTDEYVEKRYSEFLRRIEEALEQGKSVVADATFSKRKHRQKASRIALKLKADFQIVQVICSEKLVKERIEGRKKDASRAGFAQHMVYREVFELPDSKEGHICVIINTGTVEQLEKRLNMIF